MIKLNLTAENDCQQAIKDYLEQNVSEILADKINNGVKIEKDGKSLIDKKTLTQFWAYASKKAQEMKTGYVANETVFGWAIHYFEENEIIGTLYNEDDSEYKPPKPEYKPVPALPFRKSTKSRNLRKRLYSISSQARKRHSKTSLRKKKLTTIMTKNSPGLILIWIRVKY